MTEERLQEIVERAVRAGMESHECKFFADKQAQMLHEVADKLDTDQLTALSLMARAVNGVAARVGQVLVWGMLGAIVLALLLLIKMNLLPSV